MSSYAKDVKFSSIKYLCFNSKVDVWEIVRGFVNSNGLLMVNGSYKGNCVVEDSEGNRYCLVCRGLRDSRWIEAHGISKRVKLDDVSEIYGEIILGLWEKVDVKKFSMISWESLVKLCE